MKKRLIPLLLSLVLLTACAPAPPAEEEGTLRVLATTYPIYLFAAAVTDGVEGIALSRLNTGEQSCLHDYTLSVTDMKAVEGADLIAMNGLELEEFLEDSLSRSTAAVADCSAGVEPLETAGHDHEEGADEGHDHGHFDPHIWMDPRRAAQMVQTLADALSSLDPDRAQRYQTNAQTAQTLLLDWDRELRALLVDDPLTAPRQRQLITFHDGFQYFASAYDLTILRSIEEEEGSTASAKEIIALVELVQEHRLPAIFTEVSGSQATAQAIARETGVQVGVLSMIMDGEGTSLSAYLDAQMQNALTIIRGFAGQEVTIHP